MQENKEAWRAADAVVFINGELDEEIIYKKSTALQSWMFGMEMHNTITVLAETGILILAPAETGFPLFLCIFFVYQYTETILSAAEKLQFAKGTKIEGHELSLQILVKEEDCAANFDQLIKAIKQSKAGVSFFLIFFNPPKVIPVPYPSQCSKPWGHCLASELLVLSLRHGTKPSKVPA